MRNGMSEKDAGYLGYLASVDTIHNKKIQREEIYNQNPKICQYCGKYLDYKHRHNKFCSKSCAASFNNLHRDNEVYKKQKETLSNTLNKKYGIKHKVDVIANTKKNRKQKIKYCAHCGAVYGKCIDPIVCSKYRIFNSLVKFGFNKSTIGTENIIDEFYRIKNILKKFYSAFSSNNNKLIEIFGYTSGSANFIKLLKSLDIPIKSQQDAIAQAWIEGRIDANFTENQYKSCWYTTWDKKEVYLRSSYELDFAKYLDSLQISYEVESLRIKYFDSIQKIYRCAIPDFFIPETNELIEIKSNWTLKGNVQNMKDKFNRYIELGYKPKLYLEKHEVNINDITENYLESKT